MITKRRTFISRFKKFPRLRLAALGLLAMLSGIPCSESKERRGFDFLNIGAGTRQMAMANAGAALKGDSNSAEYNPAALSDLYRQEASFLYTRWMDDVSYSYMSYAYPHDRFGTFGLNMHYLNAGKIAGYDHLNQRTDDPEASDTAIGVSYGKGFANGASFGMTSRHIKESLGGTDASTYGFDAGTQYRFPGQSWWSNAVLGAAVKNIGPAAKFAASETRQPMEVNAGIGVSEWKNRLNATFEVHKPMHDNISYRTGAEIVSARGLILRAGYSTGHDLRTGLSAGIGLQFWDEDLKIDYAFIPFDEFGNAHRIGFSYQFGGILQSYFKKGVRYMKARKYAEAIIQFHQVLKLKPTHKKAIEYIRRCGIFLRYEDKMDKDLRRQP